MLISCQNCATSYQVDPSSLGATGRSVRCARCKRVWFAANPAGFTQITEADRADLAAVSGTSAIADPAESPPLADDAAAMPEAEWAATPELPPEGADAPPPPLGMDGELPAQSQQPLPIVAGPALAPMQPGDAATAADDRIVGEDIETVALRRANEEASRWPWRWPFGTWPSAVLALIAINAALIGGRAEVVRWAPQTASLYAAIGLPINLRGLVFANVTSQKEIQDGVQALVVEGTIMSTGSRATEVPHLRFGLRNDAGQLCRASRAGNRARATRTRRSRCLIRSSSA
jgi:predicted Zn finger-like uncharacterized protein